VGVQKWRSKSKDHDDGNEVVAIILDQCSEEEVRLSCL
jgi:hypothetical protein